MPTTTHNNKKPYGYLFVIAIFLITIIYYHQYKYDFDCQDFGLKIAAANFQLQGKDAYFFTEANGSKVVNGVVSTPFLNTLHTAFINLNSCQIKGLSFWVNFGLLFVCLLFAKRFTNDAYWPRLYILITAIAIFILFAKPFIYNMSAGQIYLLFAALFFLLFYLFQKKQYLLLGVVWALAIAVRPIFLAGTVLALLYFNRKIVMGLIAGAVLVVLITLFSGTTSYWKEYSQAMKEYAYQTPFRLGIKSITFVNHPVADELTYSDCKGKLSPGAMVNMRVSSRGTEFRPLQFWLLKKHKVVTNSTVYSAIACLLSLLVAIALRIRFKSISTEQYLAAIFTIYFICELCVPAPRGAYNLVIWLFGISLIISKGNIAEIGLMILGLLIFYNVPPFTVSKLGELVMFISCLMFLFRKNKITYYFSWVLKKMPQAYYLLLFEKKPASTIHTGN